MATDTPSQEQTEGKPAGKSQSSSRRRSGLRWLAVAAGLALLIAMLPAIVGRTPLGNLLLRYVSRELKLNGSLSAGGLSLGWLSPPAVQDLEIRDARGATLLTVSLVEMDKTLWQLFNNRTQLGGVKLDRPVLQVAVRENGSNLEDVFSAWLPANIAGEVHRIDCAVEAVDGQAIIRDEMTKREWKLERLKLALQSPGATAEPIKLIASGAMPAVNAGADFAIRMRLGGAEPAEIKFDAKALPLEVAQGALRRLAPGSRWAGNLNAQLHYHAGEAADQQLLEGEAVVSQFALSAPWLGVDQLALARLELPCRLDWKADHLTIEELGLACDLGEVECYAALADSSELLKVRSLAQFIELASQGVGEASGRLDLAKLAKLLPGTLRIRQGAEISAGDVEWQLASRPQADGPSWQGNISTTRLVARCQGEELTWDQPFAVHFNAHQTAQGIVFDQLGCQADFLQLEGSGTVDGFHLAGKHDLAKLTAQLSRFVDLGGAQLTGAGTTTLDWRRLSENRFQAAAEMHVNGWTLVRPGQAAWAEPQIVVTADATGELSGMKPAVIDTARCEFLSGRDRLDARLARPATVGAAPAAWPIDVVVAGELASWLSRLERQPPQPGSWQLAGECQGRGQIQYSAGSVAGAGELIVDNFVARSPTNGVWNDPQLKLTGQAAYDRNKDSLQVDQAQLVSAAVELDARGKIEQLSGERNAQLDGQATYDWARLQGLVYAFTRGSVRLAGRETRPFSLAGPLSALNAGRQTAVTRLSGRAEVGWESARLLGTMLGPGEIKAELARGAVRCSPLELPLSGGKLRLAPVIELAATPFELSLQPGRIVDQVQITPEMCNAGMKYALPVLADVTEAQGRFSVTLDGCQLPLSNPGAGDAAGKILIHSVEIGPGALTREFAPVIQVLAQALGARGAVQPLGTVAITRESQVDYRMVQGRVYHRGLELAFPDVTVRTYGSVGLDQSLAIMAEMPVPSKWIGDNALGRSLEGQTIRLPINGTLQQPKIDAREIERLTGRVVEDSARNMLHQEIGRQLDRLFTPLNGPK